MKYFRYVSILSLIALLPCDLGGEPEVSGTKVQAMAGEWWINN